MKFDKFAKPNRSYTADCKFAAVKGENGKPNMLRGYAMVWGVKSSDRGGYKVRLQRGSARFAAPTLALYDHSTQGGTLGDTESSTLRILAADDVGQPVEIDMPDTTLGKDTFELVRTRRIRGMSFAMDPFDVEWREYKENGEDVIEAVRFTCDEVTVTARPAFVESTIVVAGSSQDAGDYAAVARSAADRTRFDAMRFAGLTL